MLIGGELVNGSGDAVEVVNPATEERFTEVASATRQQVDSAVSAARRAFRGWKRTPAPERGEMLHALSTWITEHTDELATTLTREGGKPRVENRDEMGWSASCLGFYAELGRMERGRVIPSGEAGQLNLVVKEPFGPVAAIVPWNYPILLLMWKLAPALAAGNTVVVKPSPYTPLSTLELCEGFAEIFPAGVVNVVAGGADTGSVLTHSKDVALVAFTGSVETGKAVMRAAAEQIKKVHLELGGKDAFIVCEDVDLDVATRGSVWAAYLNAGQVCTSAERFYVMDEVYDDFVDVDENMDLFSKETFGPVAPIARVSSMDEAIERANSSELGLGANVYTRRLDYMLQAIEDIEAGTVWFNDPLTDNEAAPFGGMKASGIGRELGAEGLDDFRQSKHVHIDTKMEHKAWWYPYSEYVKHQAEHGTAPG